MCKVIILPSAQLFFFFLDIVLDLLMEMSLKFKSVFNNANCGSHVVDENVSGC